MSKKRIERIKPITKLIEKGFDVEDIAKKLNVSRSTIMTDMRTNGLRTHQQIEREESLKTAKNLADEMIKAEEYSTTQISKATGLSKVTIDQMKQKQNGHPAYDQEIDPKQLKKENQLWNLALFSTKANHNLAAG